MKKKVLSLVLCGVLFISFGFVIVSQVDKTLEVADGPIWPRDLQVGPSYPWPIEPNNVTNNPRPVPGGEDGFELANTPKPEPEPWNKIIVF